MYVSFSVGKQNIYKVMENILKFDEDLSVLFD